MIPTIGRMLIDCLILTSQLMEEQQTIILSNNCIQWLVHYKLDCKHYCFISFNWRWIHPCLFITVITTTIVKKNLKQKNAKSIHRMTWTFIILHWWIKWWQLMPTIIIAIMDLTLFHHKGKSTKISIILISLLCWLEHHSHLKWTTHRSNINNRISPLERSILTYQLLHLDSLLKNRILSVNQIHLISSLQMYNQMLM